MEALADFIARYAVAALFAAAITLLIAAGLLWKLINAYAPSCWLLTLKAARALAGTRFAARTLNLPMLGRSVSGTLAAARVLGLFAILAFTFAAFALSLFFELVDEIGPGEAVGHFDVALATALGKHLSYGTLRFFAVITRLGDPEFLIALGTIVAAALLARRRWILACAWIGATVSGALLNRLLKAVFERARPLHDHGVVSETGWSFPSGHASGSMVVYGLLGYLIIRNAPRAWHVPVALASVALITFVGSSRVLLQVHYLSDVLAGYASGAAWVALCIAGLEMFRHRLINVA
jgi:membrane-associated phospholipid phosphatase